MRALDQTSSLFWLLVSIAVFVESIRLGIGTLHNPGTGFLTFGASGILGILSLIQLLRASLHREELRRPLPFAGKFWKRILFVLMVLILYSRWMPVLLSLIHISEPTRPY